MRSSAVAAAVPGVALAAELQGNGHLHGGGAALLLVSLAEIFQRRIRARPGLFGARFQCRDLVVQRPQRVIVLLRPFDCA
ncbi:hypothetical protein LP419_40555 [Massilia sp. H-1]|nr:hypothetical protein LP419_40555 [Massilia sp. H-1]